MDTFAIIPSTDEFACTLTSEEVRLIEAFISGNASKEIIPVYNTRSIVKGLLFYLLYKGVFTPKMTEKRIRAAEMCLIANGIEPDEADAVLQAIGYILLDRELYPEKSKKEA